MPSHDAPDPSALASIILLVGRLVPLQIACGGTYKSVRHTSFSCTSLTVLVTSFLQWNPALSTIEAEHNTPLTRQIQPACLHPIPHYTSGRLPPGRCTHPPPPSLLTLPFSHSLRLQQTHLLRVLLLQHSEDINIRTTLPTSRTMIFLRPLYFTSHGRHPTLSKRPSRPLRRN